MKISYINDLDGYTLVASSAETDYPITNTQQIHLSRIWRATGDTENVVMDTTLSTPQGAFVTGTNLSDTAIVKIQGNSTDVWTSPTVDITMNSQDGVYYAYDGFSEQRYWRFYIEDTSNPSGYIEVGRMWLGDVLEVSGPAIQFAEVHNNTSITTISISGQAFGDTGYVYRSYEMAYPAWSAEEKDNIQTFADYVNKVEPFFTQFAGSENCELGPFYMIMTNSLEYTHLDRLDIWSAQINFREVF